MAHVLIADDDADIRDLVAFKLTQVGHQVTAVEDGMAPLRAARKGAAGNMGAEGLAARCQELEEHARAGDPASLTETAPCLQDELDRTCRTLATLRYHPPGHEPG